MSGVTDYDVHGGLRPREALPHARLNNLCKSVTIRGVFNDFLCELRGTSVVIFSLTPHFNVTNYSIQLRFKLRWTLSGFAFSDAGG